MIGEHSNGEVCCPRHFFSTESVGEFGLLVDIYTADYFAHRN